MITQCRGTDGRYRYISIFQVMYVALEDIGLFRGILTEEMIKFGAQTSNGKHIYSLPRHYNIVNDTFEI